jgi:hypothetical protein
MFLLLQSFRTAWVDSFPGTTPTTYSSGYGEKQTPSASSDGGVYILNSLFNRCTSTSDGGALYCSKSVTYLLIESTSFFSCNTYTGYGGAIYFENTNNGQSVLYGVCCNDCCSTYIRHSYGQFGYIQVGNNVLNKNYVNYSSISRCMNENSNSYYMLYLYNGKICCPSVNISLNKCYSYLGIYCYSSAISSYVTLSYSTFTDNNITGYVCIYLGGGTNSKLEMKCCNVLRNTHPSGSWGLFYIYGNMTIDDSCIIENNAPLYFEMRNPNSITLSNCTIDKTTKYGNLGTLIIRKTVTKSFILTLNHISTEDCHFTFTISPSNKKKFYYSCKNYNYIVRLSDLILNWVFIFTFIHPGSSNECYI